MRRNRGPELGRDSGSQPGRRQAHCDGTGVDAGRDLGQVRAAAKTYGGDVTAQYNTAATARGLGTAAPDQLLIQSPEASHHSQRARVPEQSQRRGARRHHPVDTGAGATGLADMLSDTARQRLYIANPGKNRIEIFDMKQQQLLTPIPVGQLPLSIAFGGIPIPCTRPTAAANTSASWI